MPKNRANEANIDRVLAEKLLDGICLASHTAIDAMLEFAALEWDRLGKKMRANAALASDKSELALLMQRISIGAGQRSDRLRAQKTRYPADV